MKCFESDMHSGGSVSDAKMLERFVSKCSLMEIIECPFSQRALKRCFVELRSCFVRFIECFTRHLTVHGLSFFSVLKMLSVFRKMFWHSLEETLSIRNFK